MGGTSSLALPGNISKIIIGIGNPGYFFSSTRHNVGLIFIDLLIKTRNIPKNKIEGGDLYFLPTGNDYLAFFRSNSYMNLSGNAVTSALRTCKITDYNDIIVIHDDLETALGKIKIQQGGSAKGHNGIKSIIENLKTYDFKRIRVGIGRPESRNSFVVSRYVTSNFSSEEMETLKNFSFVEMMKFLREANFLPKDFAA